MAEDSELSKAKFIDVFILMQYFGYLRHNSDDLTDHDFGGWQFWLGWLGKFNVNFIQAGVSMSAKTRNILPPPSPQKIKNL